MEFTADVQKYGGKAALLHELQKALPKLPIPPFSVYGYAEPFTSAITAFNQLKKPVIVRSSSPHELFGFDGIYETVKDVDSPSRLEHAIRKVHDSADSELAKAYASVHKISIDHVIHCIIQEQTSSAFTGAMLRHPNNPELLFITMYSGKGGYTNNGLWKEKMSTLRAHNFLTYNTAENRAEEIFCLSNRGIEIETGAFLAEQYAAIEQALPFLGTHSLVVEFGFNPFYVYQARPFRKKETADFAVDVPTKNKKREEYIRSDFALGITSREGIVFPVLRGLGTKDAKSYIHFLKAGKSIESFFQAPQDKYLFFKLEDMAVASRLGLPHQDSTLATLLSDHNTFLDDKIKKPYCFVTTSANRELYHVDLTIPHAQAVITGGMDNFLVHEMMRLLADSKLVVGHRFPPINEFYTSLRSLKDSVRIISNGKKAVVIRE